MVTRFLPRPPENQIRLTMPSNIAAVTLALRNLLKAALPPYVEVTTLAPAQAEHFAPDAGTVARLNVALYRIGVSPHRPNAGFVRSGSPGDARPLLPPLDLRYIITAYAAPGPADPSSEERLLETSLRAISGNPLLTSAQLTAALPAEAGTQGTRRATIDFEDLPELDRLFTSLRAGWRPALAVLVRLTEG
jgi:Pvc16 N-terminal domain